MSILDSVMPSVVKTLLSQLGTTAKIVRRVEDYDPTSGTTVGGPVLSLTVRCSPPQANVVKGVPIQGQSVIYADAVAQDEVGNDVAFDPKWDDAGGQDVVTIAGVN